MKRKTSTTAVKIYTFGCQQPTEEVRKTIFDNLYLSKQYANSAIAVENKYKVEYSKEQTSSSEQLKLLNEQKDILLSEQSNYRKQINKKNSDNKKLTNNESINSKLKTIQKELKVLNGKIKIEKEKLKGNENFQKNIEKK